MSGNPRGIATGRRVAVLVGLEDGSLLAVVEDARLSRAIVTGKAGEPMREIAVRSSRVLGDGGTTVDVTDEGTLRIPAALQRGRFLSPTWAGRPVSMESPGDYAISLDGSPVIVARQAA